MKKGQDQKRVNREGFDRKKYDEIISGDLLRQDPSVVIPRLLAIIRALPDENAALREIIESQGKLIKAQQAQIEVLTAQNETLQLKVRELEARLNKDSHNSSKPPSSDGLRKKPRTKSLRKPSGKSPGGQPGHKGKTLRMSDNPDRVVAHPVDNCKGCGHILKEVVSKKVERRQVFDVPILKIEVTEHQGEIKVCPFCGVKNRAEFPAEAKTSLQYGVGVKSLASVMMSYQLIPYKRLSEFFSDIFGQSVSSGTLNNIFGELYESLESCENAVKEKLKESGVVGFDETGMRSEGKLHWIHSASNWDFTYYHIHKKRGEEGMKSAGILPDFHGRAVHDHWKSYFKFPCKHALCNAHHLRELNGVIENGDHKWASDIRELLLEIKSAVDRAKESERKNLDALTIADFEKKYENILNEGYKDYPSFESVKSTESVGSTGSSLSKKPGKRGRKKRPPSLNLLLRLRYNMEETLAFMHDFRVPFDNNRSERDIRMVKLKQKISGTFRGNNGAQWFCRIRGYISTVRKQGLHVLKSIHNAFLGKSFMPMNY